MTPEEIRKKLFASAGVNYEAPETPEELFINAQYLYDKHDYGRSFDLAKKAADQDHPVAANLVGLCYINGLGADKDTQAAKKYFEMSACGGWPAGKRNLAVALIKQEVGPVDFKAAAILLKEAVELGDMQSPRILALLYWDGKGVEKDLEKAVVLLSLGLQRGDNEAKKLLAQVNDLKL